MEAVRGQVGKVAGWIAGGKNSDTVLYLDGETGTGKTTLIELLGELCGRSVHTINAASLVPELAMAEIFGHARGAYSGAVRSRDGAIATAKRGILFIDEVTRLRRDVQGALLRVVRERKYRRVGEDTERNVECVLAFASCDDIDAMVDEGTFLKDLRGRITMMRLRVPPLRERIRDIKPLAQLFASSADTPIAIDPDAMPVIQTYEYPHNVAGLRNLVMACGILGGGTITEPVVRRWIAAQRACHGAAAPVRTLSAVQRRRQDIRHMLIDGDQSAQELATHFSVSSETIRSDMSAIGAHLVGAGPTSRWTLNISKITKISKFGDSGDPGDSTADQDDRGTP